MKKHSHYKNGEPTQKLLALKVHSVCWGSCFRLCPFVKIFRCRVFMIIVSYRTCSLPQILSVLCLSHYNGCIVILTQSRMICDMVLNKEYSAVWDGEWKWAPGSKNPRMEMSTREHCCSLLPVVQWLSWLPHCDGLYLELYAPISPFFWKLLLLGPFMTTMGKETNTPMSSFS